MVLSYVVRRRSVKLRCVMILSYMVYALVVGMLCLDQSGLPWPQMRRVDVASSFFSSAIYVPSFPVIATIVARSFSMVASSSRVRAPSASPSSSSSPSKIRPSSLLSSSIPIKLIWVIMTRLSSLSLMTFGDGRDDGSRVGFCDGVELGSIDGKSDADGRDEGCVEGSRETVGLCDGMELGSFDGSGDANGRDEGLIADVGKLVGSYVGVELGNADNLIEGNTDGVDERM